MKKRLQNPKPTGLNCSRAVKANISPIFGLFDDEKRVAVELCKKIARRHPDATARDKESTFHKLWVVTDTEIIEDIEKYLSNKKIFIARWRHHRYETAWNYSQERKEKDKTYSSDKPYNYVLAYLCPMEDPGISIWPTTG